MSILNEPAFLAGLFRLVPVVVLFVMHPLAYGENKIVQNADKIVHCELAVMHLYLYM